MKTAAVLVAIAVVVLLGAVRPGIAAPSQKQRNYRPMTPSRPKRKEVIEKPVVRMSQEVDESVAVTEVDVAVSDVRKERLDDVTPTSADSLEVPQPASSVPPPHRGEQQSPSPQVQIEAHLRATDAKSDAAPHNILGAAATERSEASAAAGAGEEQHDAGAGEEQHDAGTGEEQHDAGAGDEQPDAGAGEEQPDAGAGEEQPDAGAGEKQHDAGAGEEQHETARAVDSAKADRAPVAALQPDLSGEGAAKMPLHATPDEGRRSTAESHRDVARESTQEPVVQAATPEATVRRTSIHNFKQRPPSPNHNHLFPPQDKGSELRYLRIKKRLQDLESTMRKLAEVVRDAGGNIPADDSVLPLGVRATDRLEVLEQRVNSLEHRANELNLRSAELLQVLQEKARIDTERLAHEASVEDRLEQERVWEEERMRQERERERLRVMNEQMTAQLESMASSTRTQHDASSGNSVIGPVTAEGVAAGVAIVLLLLAIIVVTRRRRARAIRSGAVRASYPFPASQREQRVPTPPPSLSQAQQPIFSTNAQLPHAAFSASPPAPTLMQDTTWTTTQKVFDGEVRNRALSRWAQQQ